ncbi:penicillin-binding protein 2 [Thiospirochaeta perfilievii]|uniref:Penicillin-binding protein 2 n=1 Tax=Thiospirochaeta perfilievii TaxID=252967 RepID=A0A5C1QFC9_9SPIO|nr:penicillin-binding protein 2 [Thiospirochaeta perfilievii]QEN05830.1 penicillin-binding protein 2 [Thiospirochaeta perfilievii]
MKKPSLKRIDIIKIIALSTSIIVLINFISVMVLGKSPSPPEIPRIARGNIVDRNGRILAFQKEVPSLAGWVTELKDEKESALLLAPILNIDEKIIYDHLTKERQSSYFYIKRQISEDAAGKIEELLDAQKLKGIRIEREFGRSYPEGELTSHITGYVGYDNIGLDGIEYTLNGPLSPKQIVSTNKQEYGHNVHLTIDLNLQYFTAIAAKEAYETNFADSVSVIAMDAKNGEILSYVSYPTYDPNNFNLYTQSERTNRIAQQSYEPGSVYKVFSIASFLELDGITTQSEFFCDGLYVNEEDSVTINCLGNHGWVTPEDILVHSCNDGTAQASETVSQLELYSMLKKFGFGNQTGITFNGESNGILRDPSTWSVRSKPTISMGQEISVSAIQVVTAATALTNSGVLLKPHIVKKISTQEGVIKKVYEREPVREVITPEVAKSVLEMMKATTERGTGRLTKIDGLNISTKTGTSQITNLDTGTYYDDRFIASALAIFPTEKPEVIMYVVIENPKGRSIYGSKLAVPVIKNLVDDFTNYLNIPTDSSPIYKVESNINLSSQEIRIGKTIPNFIGLSKRVVLSALDKKRLNLL